MIFKPCQAESLYDLAREDIARNYFICYTMDNNQSYDRSWRIDKHNEPVIGVFLRKTGLIQIAVNSQVGIEHYSKALESLLSETLWVQANVTERVMNAIVKTGISVTVEKSAIISECKPNDYVINTSNNRGLTFMPLQEHHLDDVVEIYKGVFKSFARKDYMASKLKAGRGSGVVALVDHQIVAVAQTDYESENGALIVGVATKHDQHGKGYGRTVMGALCTPLIHSGKTLYLQYDSPVAGRLYESMGFKKIEQNYFVKNMTESQKR